MGKSNIKIEEGNTGFLTVSLLNDLLKEIRGLRVDLKPSTKPKQKAKAKKK